MRLDHDELQRQLHRSRAENSILAETNRDLRQAIALIEDEKTRCLEEVEKLQQDKHALQEENTTLIREKELSTVCMLYNKFTVLILKIRTFDALYRMIEKSLD